MKLTIEKELSLQNEMRIKKAYSKGINLMLNAIEINLKDSDFEVGSGGSHVWIADKRTGDRVAIIEEIED